MCDTCADFVQLLINYESHACIDTSETAPLTRPELDVICIYLQTWAARQCMCCYRDSKNLDRFNLIANTLINMAVRQMSTLLDYAPLPEDDIQEVDKLLILVSKVFLLNFPLYVAYKHTIQAKLDELSQQELQNLNLFCDIHDAEIPIHLLKNVSWFCKLGGLLTMTNCFSHLSPDHLPITTAHAMISIVGNLKLWMNYKSMGSMLIPLRSCVLRYMCKLPDQDLRTQTVKNMADFMWNAIKDPLDTPVTFDADGLDLAFKYFISSTLTMRLAGITQINSQIGVLAEMCVGEALPEAEASPRLMADWLITNNIISHIFGPNLHVEVIKQSHIILNFLAMEGRITCDHMDIIWAAAQLKHCSKPVHDLLPGLVKHLSSGPTKHLYNCLIKLETKDHTEQTLFLASALIKSMWSKSSGIIPELGMGGNPVGNNLSVSLHKCATSSENSVSMEASNSDEEHAESTGQSESHKSDSDLDGAPIPDIDFMVENMNATPTGKTVKRHEIGSSTDPEPETASITACKKSVLHVLAKGKELIGKRRISPSIRKKLLNTFTVLPDGIETIASSSSQDESGGIGESVQKMRKRRRVLRKSRAKRHKNTTRKIRKRIHTVSPNRIEGFSELDVDTDPEHKEALRLKAAIRRSGTTPLIVPNQIPAAIVEAGLKAQSDYIDEDSTSGSDMIVKEMTPILGSHPDSARSNFLTLHTQQDPRILEILSGEEAESEVDADGSYSSRMSNKSEKNMADFDGEDSVGEEELVQLAEDTHIRLSPADKSANVRFSATFKPETVCQPGNTILWDLLQDDKICQLSEGLAIEAEKTLCNLICYTSDKEIKMKFIEGCLHNLANNVSVIVSLRMLPKLLTSFRGSDMHHVTQWAERQHHMMRHFFNNLKTYALNADKITTSMPLYTHQMQVQVRLHFLSAIFSPVISSSTFKLSIDQVDTLWECLANDSDSADELFSWLLSQTKTTELHALKIDALRRLYTHHLPNLNPERYSMICLSLFQQLCSLNHLLCVATQGNAKTIDNNSGMDHMWRIALRANNTDVSMAAVQYINSYYMGQNLQNEDHFVSQCMTHIQAAAEDLNSSSASSSSAYGTGADEAPLLRIQRALLLMKSHIETFRRRYAYHLRRWALEGKAIGSHSSTANDRTSSPVRLVVQSGSTSERCYLDMLSCDYIADLRAEIVMWAENLTQIKRQDESNGLKSGDTWIRIITQGQELTVDCDEKSLGEMGFKDNQMIYMSVGVARGIKKREFLDLPSVQPPPPRESIPTLLLLKPNYFEQLFSLMHTLSAMKTPIKGGHHVPHTKAQVLSRRVWDILSLLPTSPILLQGFKTLNTPLCELLDPSSAQKLMYSLYLVESLCSNSNASDTEENNWARTFIQQGGLRHLYDIFLSGVLQRDGGDGYEWQQDCLASLLKILCQLGLEPLITETRPLRNEKITIPKITDSLLQMLDVNTTMPQLMSILEEVSLPRDPNHYKTGFWGRAQVVHHTLALLVSWMHCCEAARQALFNSNNFSIWLQRLVLEDPEPAVRREVCSAIYRLCLGTSNTFNSDTSNEYVLVAPMLAELLHYFEKAESMRPPKLEIISAPEDGKEPYGPACRDYFWLVARLVDSLPDEVIRESIDEPHNCLVDVNALCDTITKSMLNREYLETRHRTVDDDGLIGELNVLTNIMKHHPPFQISSQGRHLLHETFDYLFALPTPKLRHVPRCKSVRSRSAAFDLLVELVKGAPENYALLHEKLLKQHQPGPHSPYPWDYWPHEDGRSECGYVGLTNLGATCYMASCMQHLYMMPQARASILAASTIDSKHEPTLKELQRMFAYLLESERKAYNPRSFCKVYTMDHQPLNTAEQKDMAEFFIDLVSKLEEMTSSLKNVVKQLFCGVLSNNVVSLDCDHVSRTLEEFYTVRCQVADMRNLYESLDEVTVKDTLEGDNMYTCSQCGKKVRAEKRACFKKLPHILCFNTMRYTFNMLTMLKEKVNTHFSFPLRLNMAGYVEKQLMPQQYQQEKCNENEENNECEQYEYDLIGVTVHTGTADGGHYYSFIKDRSTGARDKWFLFNDAEVKPFDPNQIAAECFGGEMTSKTYDTVTDKFLDFSFEKTNSAYMLFYERCPLSLTENLESSSTTTLASNECITSDVNSNVNSKFVPPTATFELSKELEDWIWQDNMHFIQDKNIFEHTYFNFMWQICGYIPQTILPADPNITRKAAQLSTSFFIETFIHAKEKPTMVQWVELLTKQFNACQDACIWFLEHMATDTWWPIQVLLKCPNQMVRQMFQRLCIHVIQRLRQSQSSLYLIADEGTIESNHDTIDPKKIGNGSCVTKFIKTLLSLMEHGAKAHLKHLTEYFGFFYEFSKMGEDESKFLLAVGAINTMIQFYLGQKANEFVDVSEGEDEEEPLSVPTEKYKPASLDKMISLIASLVEKSRDSNMQLQLSPSDYIAIAEGKGYPFLYQQIKDNINLQQTRNLIHSLCRGNNQLAQSIISMVSQAISRHSDTCQPFFKILTLLTESGSSHQSSSSGTSASHPCFTQLVLQKVWDAAESCPYSALDWLALQVTRNRLIHQWVLASIDTWLEHFLITHSNQRVRNAAGYLLVSLVPNAAFRQGFRATHRIQREPQLSNEAQVVLHQIYAALLRLLSAAKHYTDMHQHGTMKLTTFFALLMYCCISRTEKLMFGQYFLHLWHLFHPKLSEPSIPAHHNKQALLAFWNHVCNDCPENVQSMLQNAHVTKNIAFNYILADHDDQEIVLYNRAMLPAYYGILRLMCLQSRVFTRHLAQHQNLQWAFKNITPHPTQYPQATDELFKLMQLMVMKYPDTNEVEEREISGFKRSTLMTYLQCLDGRTSWGTLISAFRILLDSTDDKLYVAYNGGLQIVFECFQNLHIMLHEATACHVTGDVVDILAIMFDLVRCVRLYRDNKEASGIMLSTKDWLEVIRKLATLLNTYNPPEIRVLCIEILKEFIIFMSVETIQILVQLLSHCHSAFQDSHDAVPLGPYFPRRGHALPIIPGKGNARPLRPMVQMTVPHNQLECTRGVDAEYDEALDKFYAPYHELIDVLFRHAVKTSTVSEVLVSLSAVVGYEAVPLHSTYFPKLWLDIYHSEHIDRKFSTMLTSCNYFIDYVDAILLDERLSLTVDIIYEFFVVFFPRVATHVLSEQTLTMVDNTVVALSEQIASLEIPKLARRLSGDLRALIFVYNSPGTTVPLILPSILKQIQHKVHNELCVLQLVTRDKDNEEGDKRKSVHSDLQRDEDICSKPGTSKQFENSTELAVTNKTKNDSDTSSSGDESGDDFRCVTDLKLLDSSVKELFAVVQKET